MKMSRKRFGRICSLLVAIIGYMGAMSVSYGNVQLPAIIGDNMVLQSDSMVKIWGWADAGEEVAVVGSWADSAKAGAKADEKGKWMVQIRSGAAGGTHSLTVKGKNEIKINNILFGEVWIGSGQSNMEWSVSGSDNAAAEIAAAQYPNIRLFKVRMQYTATPQEKTEGQWVECSEKTIGGFSAAEYFFGRELHTALKAPVGLIQSAWGGTPAEAWTSPETIARFGEFGSVLDMLKAPQMTPEAQQAQVAQALVAWDKKIDEMDAGMKNGWSKAGADISGWKSMNQPALWANSELQEIDGVVWFCRQFDCPAGLVKQDKVKLLLGAVDDMDTVWINGEKAGATSGWNVPRVYTLAGSLLKEKGNYIAIRIIDNQGEGGFYGQANDLRLEAAAGEDQGVVALAGSWKYQIGIKSGLPVYPAAGGPMNQNTATCLYNAMIHPVINYRIAGAIWYQGESNIGRHKQYQALFPAMIADWRAKWGIGDFPFYYVQIAPYIYNPQSPSPELREAQMLTLKASPNVGMAVTMDIGVEKDIHPTNKQDVGKRLALWALAKTYQQPNVVCSGPIYKGMKVEGSAIRLSFDYAGMGLEARKGDLTDFTIAGDDKQFVPAKAVIDGETIVVSSDKIAKPVAVRYAWSNWVCTNLYNKAGLPASSFRTDGWE